MNVGGVPRKGEMKCGISLESVLPSLVSAVAAASPLLILRRMRRLDNLGRSRELLQYDGNERQLMRRAIDLHKTPEDISTI